MRFLQLLLLFFPACIGCRLVSCLNQGTNNPLSGVSFPQDYKTSNAIELWCDQIMRMFFITRKREFASLKYLRAHENWWDGLSVRGLNAIAWAAVNSIENNDVQALRELTKVAESAGPHAHAQRRRSLALFFKPRYTLLRGEGMCDQAKECPHGEVMREVPPGVSGNMVKKNNWE